MPTRFAGLLVMVVVGALGACGTNGATSTDSAAPTVAVSATPTLAAPTPSPSGDVSVFAAASLTDAFNQIGAEFKQANPRVAVKFNFAASTALRTQLEQGAKADIYASADQTQMDNAKKAGVIEGSDQIFVKNKLVVIYPTGNPARIGTARDLAKPGVKLVLTDQNVPIGAYARASLEKMSADPRFGPDFGRKALGNLKSEEANVRAVVTKVQLGEADAGIVYASDVTPSVAKDIASVQIPDEFNTVAAYSIAMVKDASNRAAARVFITFVRSARGQEILKENNFIIDGDTGSTRRLTDDAPPAGGRHARGRPSPASHARAEGERARGRQTARIVDVPTRGGHAS